MLGLNTARKPIQPQQYVVADMLNAVDEDGQPVHTINAICIPRRASKTTSVWAIALGRISNPDRGDYAVFFTSVTGQKARARFLTDVVKPLERKYPDPATSPFVINRSPGASYLEYKETGGRISILSPSPESARGESADLWVYDEAQEIEPGDESVEFLQGVLPTFDTRPGAQLVLLGTAGEFQGGLFWDQLENGRNGKGGICEYAIDPYTPDAEEGEPLDGTTSDPAIWATAHPGLGNLTPLSAIERNFEAMTLSAFKREYLGAWPSGNARAFLNAEKWEKTLVPGPLPQLPSTFSMAFAVHRDDKCASITAAWRDEEGRAHILLLDYRPGSKWLHARVLELSRKYKVPIVYDHRTSANQVEVEMLNRATPRPRMDPQNWAEVSTASTLFVKEFNRGAIRHYEQKPLNDAAAVAVKRGTVQTDRWVFDAPKNQPGLDVTPLLSACLALRAYDDMPIKKALPRM